MKLTNKKFFVGRPLSLLLALWLPNAHAQISVKECVLQAKHPLEIAYCELLKKGAGNTLPNFYNFRRNHESTQRLFLKSAANRAGLEMPEIVLKEHEQRDLSPKPVIQQNQTPQVQNQEKSSTPQEAESLKNPTVPNSSSNVKLTDCTLKKDQIACEKERYFLAINVPADYLNKDALTKQNKLIFREKSYKETPAQYLSNLYPIYIEKMLRIGLGDSTVSFTKFNAIYEESKQQEESFTYRFQRMYELLKSERQANAVKQRYQENYPATIESCMRLNKQLITCDNVAQNWVYKKVKNY